MITYIWVVESHKTNHFPYTHGPYATPWKNYLNIKMSCLGVLKEKASFDIILPWLPTQQCYQKNEILLTVFVLNLVRSIVSHADENIYYVFNTFVSCSYKRHLEP